MATNQAVTTSERGAMTEQITETIRAVLDKLDIPPTLHEPLFAGNERAYVLECIDTGWVSSVGSYVDRFEKMLAEFTGAAQAVAVVNGTAALQMALTICGVKPQDEVLVPSLTFVATANAVRYCGAVPHFVDVENRTLGLDACKLNAYLKDVACIEDGVTKNRRTGATIRAAVPMHTFGHPVDLDALAEVAGQWHLDVVEDAAESLGSYYKGRHTGTFGRVGALSFNGNKIVTTGGGGALLFKNPEDGKFAKHLTTTARVPHRWEYFHDMLGYNFRMPNLNAALGCAQLEQVNSFVERKRELAEEYLAAFANVPGVKIYREPVFARSNYWLNALILDEEYADQRDGVLAATNDGGVMTRPIWTPMHKLPMYAECPRMDMSVTESLEKRVINIPSSVSRRTK